MTSVIEIKATSDAQRGNHAQERMQEALTGASHATDEDDGITCIGCGARVKSAEDLTCGH